MDGYYSYKTYDFTHLIKSYNIKLFEYPSYLIYIL